MRSYIFSFIRLGVAASFLCTFACDISAQVPKKKRNPSSKLFVADVEGQSQINTGERIEDLSKKHVYDAQGTVIETKPEATNMLVFSNGTGIYIGPETTMEVKRFQQEPFTPNRTDLEVEPSISQTSSYVSRGAVALCTAKPVAGSTMVYRTPHATISMRGCQVYIEVTDKATKVSLISGDVTVRTGEMDMGGQVLHPGSQAVMGEASVADESKVKVVDIPSGDLKNIEQTVVTACMARNTVYFDTASKQKKDGTDPASAFDDSADEIVVIPVVPAQIPIQQTVSTARF